MSPTTPPGPGPRLPLGVGQASLRNDAHEVALEGDRGDLPVRRVAALDEVVSWPTDDVRPGPILILVGRLGRRARRRIDSPATAQLIAARTDAVVLVTDSVRLPAVTGLASRLVDRGVRCWVSADADRLYPRAAAAAASGFGWGLTPS